MPALTLALVLSAACMSPKDPWREAPVVPAAQKTQLDKYRKALLGAEREPEGSPKIEVAVRALAEAGNDEAHAILKQVLASFQETSEVPASTTRMVIDVLGDRLAIDLDLKEGDQRRRRLELYDSYAPLLLTIYADKGSTANGFRPPIQRWFSLLPDEVARASLTRFLRKPEPETIRAAVEVAGYTEDPALAVEVAPFLENLELRSLAQETLGRLTLRIQPFTSLEEFRVWEQKNRGLSYDELARRTALESLELARRFEKERQELARANEDKAFFLVKRILALGLSQPTPPWGEFMFLLESKDLVRHRAAILEELYRGMKARGLEPAQVKPSLKDIEKLLAFVKQGWETAPGPDRNSWLGAWAWLAYLAGGADAEEVTGVLLGKLESSLDPDGVNRVVELLTLFPSDGVRAKVLEQVLARRLVEDGTGVHAGIRCLAGLGVPTQKELVVKLRDLLLTCVRDRKVPLEARDLAIDILGELGHELVTAALQGIVQPHDRRVAKAAPVEHLEEPLRLKALAWGNTKIASELQAAPPKELDKLVQAELDFLLQCIWDASPRLRKEAARALEDFPPAVLPLKAEERRNHAQQVVSGIGGSLAEEADPGCIEQFLKSLLKQAKTHEVGATAIQRIVEAMARWAGEAQTGPEWRKQLETQAATLDEALGTLVRGKGVQPVLLLDEARRLLEARLTSTAQVLLDNEVLDGLEQPTPAAEANRERLERERVELQRRRNMAFVDLLRITGGLDRLGAERRQRVAQLLVRYQESLRTLQVDAPEVLVLLAQAHAQQNDHRTAVTLYQAWRDGPGSDAPVAERQRVRRLQAGSHYQLDEYKQAAEILAGLTDLESLLLRGRALVRSEQWQEAESLFRSLLDNPVLPDKGREREEASLGLCEALLGLDKLDELSGFEAALEPFRDVAVAEAYKSFRARKERRIQELEKGDGKAAGDGKQPGSRPGPTPGSGQGGSGPGAKDGLAEPNPGR
ncbi:MAG: hypothetical protein R3F30_06390 [Planctomycetota bacterium]